MLLRHQKWRREECEPYGWPAKTVPLDSVMSYAKDNAAWVRGVDKAGRPMVWVHAGKHLASTPREVLRRYVILCLDELLTRCNSPGYAESFTAILDAGEMGWSNLDRDALQYLLLMLSANMPERLGRLYILNEGMIFKTLWKVVELSGLLDARTAAKIKFLGGPDKHRPALAAEIAPEHLPVAYGGTDGFAFDADKHLACAEPMFESMRSGVRVGRTAAAVAPGAGAPAAEAAAGGASAVGGAGAATGK